jgi:hypothetical protein
MVTSVTSNTTTSTVGSNSLPNIGQIRSELTAALVSAGVTNASEKDLTPKGFPDGVSWTDAYRMVTKRVEDNNSATPGTLVLSQDLLTRTLSGTKTLSNLGITSLARFPKGTSVMGALDQTMQNKSNGILASTLAKAGIYDLSSFPTGTTAYQAYKLIEDPTNPGTVSAASYKNYKDSYAALTSLGITSLQNFPRAFTAIEAKNLIEPQADLMLKMVGVDKSLFKDPSISSLRGLSILSNLPKSIEQLNSLPAGTTSNGLAMQANAAKKLVSMGYDNLSGFSSMASFKGVTVTAVSALAALTASPKAVDLPRPTSASTERYFQSTPAKVTKSYGTPNPITTTVLTRPVSERVFPNPLPPTKIVTAAQVLAANIAYWSRKT